MMFCATLMLLAASAATPDAPPVGDAGDELPLTRTLEATVPLEGSDHLNMALETASIRLVAADRDDIGITLELESQKLLIFSNRRTTWAIHQAAIVATMEDGVLELGIDFPVRVDDDWLNSSWLIEVPRRMAVDIDVTSGRVDASGVEGGVTIEVVSGGITVDVPRGPLDLRSTNGGISAKVGESAFSELTIEMTNGSAVLSIDGVSQDLDEDRSLHREGQGEHSIYIETVNGGIHLDLGTATR